MESKFVSFEPRGDKTEFTIYSIDQSLDVLVPDIVVMFCEKVEGAANYNPKGLIKNFLHPKTKRHKMQLKETGNY